MRTNYELYEREVEDWTDKELEGELRRSYGPVKVPACRVCGGELSIQGMGGGKPTVYACSGQNEDMSWQEGRKPADEHYSQSHWEDRRQGGDYRVLELLRRYLHEK